MNPVSFWALKLISPFRLMLIGFEHWLGDTFLWYREREGGIWCSWGGYWAQADQNNFVRFQRKAVKYFPTNNTWTWVIDQTFKVGDTPISATENYNAVDESIKARKANEEKAARERM